jgi:hypothetical protein
MGEPALGPFTDLHMMINFTGRKRTLDEYPALIEKVGIHFSKVTAYSDRSGSLPSSGISYSVLPLARHVASPFDWFDPTNDAN